MEFFLGVNGVVGVTGVFIDEEEHEDVVEQIEFDLLSLLLLPAAAEEGRSGDLAGLLFESVVVSLVFTISGLSCLLENISRISL